MNLHEKVNDYLKQRRIDVHYDTEKGIIRDSYGKSYKVEFYDRQKDDVCTNIGADGKNAIGCIDWISKDGRIFIDAYHEGCEMDIEDVARVLLHEKTHSDLYPLKVITALLCCVPAVKGFIRSCKKQATRRDVLKILAGGAILEAYVFFEENIVNGVSFARYGLSQPEQPRLDCWNLESPTLYMTLSECEGSSPEQPRIQVCTNRKEGSDADTECYCVNATPLADEPDNPKRQAEITIGNARIIVEMNRSEG